MLMLSIDTSSAGLSVALCDDDEIIASSHATMQRGQGEALISYIQDLMQTANFKMADLNAVAVAVGPGSFTGVRIGLSAARAIGLALDIPVYGVTNFTAACYGINEPVTVVLDTKRGDYFTQSFVNGEPIDTPTIKSAEQLAQNMPFIAVGDGARTLADEIGCTVISSPLTGAEAVSHMAFKQMDNPLPPEPLYLREADVTVCPKGK